jgi:NADH dehydrogenase
MAAELKGLLDFLSWKENYPRHKLEVAIIEGSGQLMPGMGERIGRDMYDRLKSLGVQVRLNSLITNIDEQFLELKNGEKLSYDSLIWTAGVRAREMPFVDGVKVESDKTGRIMVNPMLQIENYRNISVIGDGTCFMGTDGKPLPGTARHAIDQGKYVAYALTQVMQNKKPQPYSCKNFGYIVTAGGKWAIFQTKRFYMKGFLPYLFRQIGWLHYFYTILGLRRAIRLIILENRLYGRND